ncbi:MAG: ribosomal L7Ae/L30e/S12e/Gadd45 family protein [Oscillospiraceae bacterium]
MNDPILSRLGMARRAGFISPGFDASKNALLKGKSSLIIMSMDISPKSEKEMRFFCAEDGVECIKIDKTIFEITTAIGTKAGIVSVNNEGFAKAIIKNLPDTK